MKKLFLLFILPLTMAAQADNTVVTGDAWVTNYETALTMAKEQNKNVLVYFTGSDWCAPCKMLKKDLFETQEFVTISNDYVLLYVDIPMNRDLISTEQLQHNKEVASKLNKKGSVPMMKILDPSGTELDAYSGYSMNGEVQYHLQMLKKHQS